MPLKWHESVRAVTSTMLMKNKKNHEPNSLRAILFLLILCKVHHINELILSRKSFQNLQLLLFSLDAAFCSECWQPKQNLLTSWWLCGAGASVSRIWLKSSLLPAVKAEHTVFPGRMPHLGMQENTDGQRQLKSWVMQRKKWSKKKIGAQRKKEEAKLART